MKKPMIDGVEIESWDTVIWGEVMYLVDGFHDEDYVWGKTIDKIHGGFIESKLPIKELSFYKTKFMKSTPIDVRGKKHCKKTSFTNEQYAEDYILKLEKTSCRERTPVRAYLCPKCMNWHLTSIKDAEVSALRKMVHNLSKRERDYIKKDKKIKSLTKKVDKLEKRSASFQFQLERVQMKFKDYKDQVEKAMKKTYEGWSNQEEIEQTN